MLHPYVLADHEAVSQYAASLLAGFLRQQPAALLCLATGGTPVRTYQLLAEQGAADPELFAQVRIVNLDEWGGLPPEDPGLCDRCLRTHLVDPLGLVDRYVGFASQPPDPAAEAARVAGWLRAHGPIDLCLLGLGLNGHIGFNEPAEFLQPHAHVARLSEASLGHAMVRSGGARPAFGLTLGMADLFQARRILLQATGASKQAILEQLLAGRITTELPASLLHMHANVTLLCDEAACPRPSTPAAART